MDLFNIYISRQLLQHRTFHDFKLKDLIRLYNFIKSYPIQTITYSKIVRHGRVVQVTISQASIIKHILQESKVFYRG